MQIVRYRSADQRIRIGVLFERNILAPLDVELHELLRLPLSALRTRLEAAQRSAVHTQSYDLLAPIDGTTEVWAAGVTYKRSVDARVEESQTPDLYTRVYLAQRPELFFKATPHRVAGPMEPIGIRSDSTWDVPEPELALVLNVHGEIVGYTIANDVSSRSIEGENALYLPQAKVYARSCALGPGWTPAWEVADPYKLSIRMSIERARGVYWTGQTSTSELKRSLDELVDYLFREDDFPDGAILCTGTALVPAPPFTLEPDVLVGIQIDELGALRNPVVRGKNSTIV